MMALRLSQPSPLGYVQTRLGMPRNPRMCMGKNVRLNPMNIVQKLILPSRSDSIRPVIFGIQ